MLDRAESSLPLGSPHFATKVRERAKRYADKPPLEGYAALVLLCWQDLAGERPAWGDRLGPVPYRAIMAWSADRGLDADETRLVQLAISCLYAALDKQAATERRLSAAHDAAVRGAKP